MLLASLGFSRLIASTSITPREWYHYRSVEAIAGRSAEDSFQDFGFVFHLFLQIRAARTGHSGFAQQPRALVIFSVCLDKRAWVVREGLVCVYVCIHVYDYVYLWLLYV